MFVKVAISKVYTRILSFLLLVGNIGSLQAASWQTPPEQFTSDESGILGDIAANSAGNAIAVWIDNSGSPLKTVNASYFSNGAWGPTTLLGTGSIQNVAVAFDDSGTGLAIWSVPTFPTPGTLETAYFDGSTWSTPTPNPLETSFSSFFVQPAIAMNQLGQGVAIWLDTASQEVRSSFFNAGAWTTPTFIGNGDNAPMSVAYSQNGTAVAAWLDLGFVIVNQFTGGVWQSSAVLGAPGDSVPVVGIDGNGIGYAIWTDAAGNTKVSQFNGTSWSTPQIISVGLGNASASIAVDGAGAAVSLWIDGSSVVQSSVFNGITWGAPVAVSTAGVPTQADVAIAQNGNALALWVEVSSGLVQSAFLPLGGSWSPQLLVRDSTLSTSQVIAATSSKGYSFALWEEDNFELETSDVFGSFILNLPAPPASITAKQCNDLFATQIDRINIITFTPSTDPVVVSYLLRRNGVLIAVIPANGPFVYYDHNRCKNTTYIYTLTSVNSFGVESTPITVVVN